MSKTSRELHNLRNPDEAEPPVVKKKSRPGSHQKAGELSTPPSGSSRQADLSSNNTRTRLAETSPLSFHQSPFPHALVKTENPDVASSGAHLGMLGLVKQEDTSITKDWSAAARQTRMQELMNQVAANRAAEVEAAAQAAAAIAAAEASEQAALQAAAAAASAIITGKAREAAKIKKERIAKASSDVKKADAAAIAAEAAGRAATKAESRMSSSFATLKTAQASYDAEKAASTLATADKAAAVIEYEKREGIAFASAEIVASAAAAETAARISLQAELRHLLGCESAGLLLTAAPKDVQNAIQEDERILADTDLQAAALMLQAGNIDGMEVVHALQLETAAAINEQKKKAVAGVLARITEIQCILENMP